MQGQAPKTMEKAIRLAQVQQKIQEKVKGKWQRGGQWTNQGTFSPTANKSEQKQQGNPQLYKERQLRDFYRTNNLCFFCREPYDATHASKCKKRPGAQVNALAVNDLDVQLNDEVLAQLEVEDALTAEFCTLSLNAITGTEVGEAMRLRCLVKNKVMLILVDSGSSHSFVSSSLSKVGITPGTASPKQVRVANGEMMFSTSAVPELQWWIQGNTFTSSMRVLNL